MACKNNDDSIGKIILTYCPFLNDCSRCLWLNQWHLSNRPETCCIPRKKIHPFFDMFFHQILGVMVLMEKL